MVDLHGLPYLYTSFTGEQLIHGYIRLAGISHETRIKISPEPCMQDLIDALWCLAEQWWVLGDVNLGLVFSVHVGGTKEKHTFGF